MVEPDYYKKYGLSPIGAFNQGLISKEEFIGFCRGNVIKYTVRAGHKYDALSDINKAIDYLEYMKEIFTDNGDNDSPDCEDYVKLGDVINSEDESINCKENMLDCRNLTKNKVYGVKYYKNDE